MLLPKIHFDESGNTGQDLLNADQPWFVLSSVQLDEDASAERLANLKVKNFREVKFSSLRRSLEGRKALIGFYDSIDTTDVRLSAFHKQFMVTTKMIDELVEPYRRLEESISTDEAPTWRYRTYGIRLYQCSAERRHMRVYLPHS